MLVWRTTEKIIRSRTVIAVIHMHAYTSNTVLTIFDSYRFLGFFCKG